MKLSSIEKQVLYMKYNKLKLNSDQVKMRLNNIDNNLKHLKEDKKFREKIKDINQIFKENFTRLKKA